MAVESDGEPTVITGDAVPSDASVVPDGTESAHLGLSVDDVTWWESAKQVLDRAAVIVPGHEWQILDAEAPED